MNLGRYSKAIAALLAEVPAIVAALVAFGLLSGHTQTLVLAVAAAVSAVLIPAGVAVAPANAPAKSAVMPYGPADLPLPSTDLPPVEVASFDPAPAVVPDPQATSPHA